MSDISSPPRLEVADVPELGNLVARMLAKEPVERPRDGGEALAALGTVERELQGVPASLVGPALAKRRSGRGRVALLAAGLAALAAVGGVVLWRSGALSPGPGRTPASSWPWPTW